MARFIALLLSIFIYQYATAQGQDSIFAVRKGSELVLSHISKSGESIAMLAERFYVSQDKIESLSMLDGRKKLTSGTQVLIPMAKDNFTAARVPSGIDYKQELFYRVTERDNIALVSMFAGIKKEELILWNSLHGNSLAIGQPLFIGWVRLVPRDSINLANGIAYPSEKRRTPMRDTAKHFFGVLDSAYNAQTANGTNVITEKGTAVFFEKPGKNDIYYAFHNTTQRGAVIKVVNPGTGKAVYVKVLGPIPDTKLYANSIIGICNAAKDALGVTDTKAWCELIYSPN
jgi:hypothetical protein